MTTSTKLGAAGAAGRQMREHRIPAMLSAGGRIVAVADPAVEAATAFVSGFADPDFLAELGGRGYHISHEAAAEFAAARVYRQVEKMLDTEPLDALISAVPTSAHAQVAMRAMIAGCHVASDKPTAHEPQAARLMLDAARDHDRVLQIGYQWPVQLAQIASLVGRGAIGELAGGSSVWTRSHGIPDNPHFWADRQTGGVTRDIATHQIAGVVSLTSGQPVQVRARATNEAGKAVYGERFKADDTVDIAIRFGGGELWRVTSSWDTPMATRESAGIVVEFKAEDVRIDAPVIVQKYGKYRADPGAFRAVIRRPGARQPTWLDKAAVSYVDAMIAQAAELLRAIEGSGTLALPAERAVMVERVVDAALRSAALFDGRWGPWVAA